MFFDPSLYFLVLVGGAFAASFVIGAVGFADALIMNAVWLQVMTPTEAIPLVVACGFAMHLLPLLKLRSELEFSRLPPFLLAGVAGVPFGVLMLSWFDPDLFKYCIGAFLVTYGVWMFLRPQTLVGETGGKAADGSIGFIGGVMGGFAGLSGLLPTLWVGQRGWSRSVQRGTFQPFVLAMHGLGFATFALSGIVTWQTLTDFSWCLPAIILGSWAGTWVYPYLNEQLFKNVVLALILISGVTLLL